MDNGVHFWRYAKVDREGIAHLALAEEVREKEGDARSNGLRLSVSDEARRSLAALGMTSNFCH